MRHRFARSLVSSSISALIYFKVLTITHLADIARFDTIFEQPGITLSIRLQITAANPLNPTLVALDSANAALNCIKLLVVKNPPLARAHQTGDGTAQTLEVDAQAGVPAMKKEVREALRYELRDVILKRAQFDMPSGLPLQVI